MRGGERETRVEGVPHAGGRGTPDAAGCPMCGGVLVGVDVRTDEYGGRMLTVLVRVARRPWSRRIPVSSFACRDCGHRQWFVTRPELLP